VDGEDAAAERPRWSAADVVYGTTTTRFRVLRDGDPWGDLESPLAGAFNVRNALAALVAADAVGAERTRIIEGLRTFRSVRRRMELRGEAAGIAVVDDFAHHPTAVRETIQAARQRFAGRRIVAIFEPRSYTAQRREFQADYEAALARADEVIIAGLFHPERYTKATAMDPHQLVASWQARGLPAQYEPDPDRIVAYLAATARTGDVMLVMSNGGFGGIHDKLLREFADRTD
jgi:UDP-N-acetylmuramate: L-alanyl-gamma-D-glutamyl-meso-diaminopimelate ligase